MGMLVVGTMVTWYSSLLMASLWEWDGVPHVSYRNLAQSIFGKTGYWGVTIFQQFASIGNNITVQIAAGTSMKAIYKVYHKSSSVTLQEFIIIFGLVELGLSQSPSIHSLRWVNAICTLCTLGFTATAIAISIYDGVNLDRSIVDYNILGSTPTKIFGIFNALGTIAFSFGDAMLPEIQSTLKKPEKINMYKGVSGAYVLIMASYWTLACVGYWAFGSSVTAYLVNSFTKPNWAIILANVFVIIQIGGCYQIYCRPTFEFFEKKFIQQDKRGKMWKRVILVRLFITTTYMIVITLIASALPFFGDFVALCGAFGFTPLDFVIPPISYLVVKRPKNKFIWILNIAISLTYSLVALFGSIGAIRFISIHVGTYKFFNDM